MILRSITIIIQRHISISISCGVAFGPRPMRFAHRADSLGHKPAPAEPKVTVANAKGWGVASSARRTTCRFMRRLIDCCCPHGYNFTGHPRAAIIQIGVSGFNASLRLKFFARKDGQDGQYEEHCDLIGKGDG